MQLKEGTRFKGNVNQVEMEIVRLENRYGNVSDGGKNITAVIKDLKTEKYYTYGLDVLRHCDITILEAER